MKFTRDWLFDHLETERTFHEILDALPMLGLEVESFVDRHKLLKPFIIAEVLSSAQHPNADKLRVCLVNIGKPEPVQVICGAPNVRSGMKSVFAPIGAYVPGIDLKLKAGKIRGEISNGMLCSEREMQLSDDHEGIIEVSNEAVVGSPFSTYADLDDPIVEIAITPNRADCLGVRGIARDLAAGGFGKLKQIDLTPMEGKFDSPIKWQIKLPETRKHLCPRVSGRSFTGLKNGPSPKWLANRLNAVGQRPINALVDITNYVMIDLGRPLHAYDIDKISGKKLVIREAVKGEKMTALNEKSYDLEDGMLVIADAEGTDDLAGIMGGERTGISEETSEMFLEIAIFDQVSVATTGRKLNINSDARYRFERGLDVTSPEWASGYVARMILDICGGIASYVVSDGPGADWERVIFLSHNKLKKLTGMRLPLKKQSEILAALGFEVADVADGWQVKPPPWRGDVDGAADLVEEIARIHGFDNLPMMHIYPEHAISQPAMTASQASQYQIRRALVAQGLTEAVTFSFLSEKEACLFGNGSYKLELINPISSDLSVMRPSVLPNLIDAAAKNQARGEIDASFFEIGPVFFGDEPEHQRTSVAAIRHGATCPRDWHNVRRGVDLYDAKADAELVLSILGVKSESLNVERTASSYFHPGRSGKLIRGKNSLAEFGEIHPRVVEHFGLRNSLVAFELFLEDIPGAKSRGPTKQFLKLSPFQSVTRDFAFLLDENLPANELIKIVKSATGPLLSDIKLFDIYVGESIPDGKKSIAVAVTMTPTAATLTDGEIDVISQNIIQKVKEKCNAELRD